MPAFAWRLAILVLALSLAATIEWYFRRSRATRWREYLLLLGCGFMGACFGMSVDLVTANVSPEYFWLGKGIDSGETFWPDVLQLGFQAGFIAGAISGGVLLVANSAYAGFASLTLTQLVRYLPWMMLVAIAGAGLGALVLPGWDLMRLREQLTRTLSDEEMKRFMIVWSVHLGLYAGGAAAVTGAAFNVWRRRSLNSIRVNP
jgi:hypothetical protein